MGLTAPNAVKNCSHINEENDYFGGIYTWYLKIQAIIVEELGKDAEEVQLTTNIQEELDADSLDLFQIINEIEDEFDVKIETEDGIQTVQDLVTYVEKQQAN